MIKRFCDCCGKELSGQPMILGVPCHLWSFKDNISEIYVDNEGNAVSGRMDSIDMCNRCSNLVFGVAVKKVIEIQKENKI